MNAANLAVLNVAAFFAPVLQTGRPMSVVEFGIAIKKDLADSFVL